MLYCVCLYTKVFTTGGGGGVNHGLLIITLDWLYLSLLNHHQCAASWMMRRLSQDSGARHTSYRWRGERVIEPIKCMLSPHTSYRWRGERDRANQVYALTTHQLQVERRERHRANQVYALTTHQVQVERRASHRVNQVYALTTHQLQVERRER